ncbi:MAG: DegT/DnrJ/EryC1/StrS family aminotransferase, partial [Clostridia bacterium]|nr:DegT/DnrJ/EryC1/StrS family aminotransferase [Clostridia bacterium]
MEEKLALYGGNPIRSERIFYGKHAVTQEDIEAVCNILKGDYLTQGPAIAEFEKELASFTNANYAVAVA